MGIFAWSHFNERAAAVIVDDVVVPIDAGLIKLARKGLDFADQRGIFAYPINRLAGFLPFGFGSTKSKTLTPNFLSPR